MFILTFFVHFYPNYPTEVLMLNLWYQMYSQKVYYQNTQPVWTLFLFKSIHPAVCEIVSKLGFETFARDFKITQDPLTQNCQNDQFHPSRPLCIGLFKVDLDGSTFLSPLSLGLNCLTIKRRQKQHSQEMADCVSNFNLYYFKWRILSQTSTEESGKNKKI